jgi:hypothetical protein
MAQDSSFVPKGMPENAEGIIAVAPGQALSDCPPQSKGTSIRIFHRECFVQTKSAIERGHQNDIQKFN